MLFFILQDKTVRIHFLVSCHLKYVITSKTGCEIIFPNASRTLLFREVQYIACVLLLSTNEYYAH